MRTRVASAGGGIATVVAQRTAKRTCAGRRGSAVRCIGEHGGCPRSRARRAAGGTGGGGGEPPTSVLVLLLVLVEVVKGRVGGCEKDGAPRATCAPPLQERVLSHDPRRCRGRGPLAAWLCARVGRARLQARTYHCSVDGLSRGYALQEDTVVHKPPLQSHRLLGCDFLLDHLQY